MAVFSQNYTLGFIKEVGEDDLLVSINGNDIEVLLTESDREAVLQLTASGTFVVAVNAETNELLLNIDDATLREEFPETDAAELAGAAEEYEEE